MKTFLCLLAMTISLGTLQMAADSSSNIVDKIADNGMKVRQIPNSESAVIDYFANIPFDCDTIYAIIFPPGNCPRCESLLSIHLQNFKDLNLPTVLISSFQDSISAKKYVESNRFEADCYIFDSTHKFKDFLSFSIGDLYVDYILKIDKKNGNLIVGCLSETISDKFYSDLRYYKTAKEQLEYLDSTPYTPYQWDYQSHKILNPSKSSYINKDDSVIFSEVHMNPLFYANELIWCDKLGNAINHLRKDGDKIDVVRTIYTDSLQNRQFSSVSDEDYQDILDNGELKFMPLQPFLIGTDKIGIGYSLPDLRYEDDNKESIEYYNKPCILIKDLYDTEYTQLIPLDITPTFDYFYKHFRMKNFGDNVVLGIERLTYPALEDEKYFKGIPEKDLFVNDFYNLEQPTLVTFGQYDGKERKKFGRLPELAAHTKTGYRFGDTLFDFWDGEITTAEKYGGKIEVSDAEYFGCEDCSMKYGAFEIDLDVIPIPSLEMLYTDECTVNVLPYMNRRIMDVKTDSRYIHCIVACNDEQTSTEPAKTFYVKIDRETGNRDISEMPEYGLDSYSCHSLRRLESGEVEPFSLVRSGKDWRVDLYE